MVAPVKLKAECNEAEELHLHIRDRQSLQTKVYTMQPNPKEGCWEVKLDLPPGAYLYRFYRRKGTSLIYHSPDGGPHPMANAWDAALSVPMIRSSLDPTATRITHQGFSTATHLTR